MWNRFDKLTKAIIIMAIIAIITSIGAFAMRQRVELLIYQKKTIVDTNKNLINKMKKALEDDLKYK